MKPGSVEGYDARGFLAAVLQSVQPERGDRGGLGVAENAEHAAFLAQRIAIKIGIGEVGVWAVDRAKAPVDKAPVDKAPVDKAQIVKAQIVLCGGVIGRALFAVHRASLLA